MRPPSADEQTYVDSECRGNSEGHDGRDPRWYWAGHGRHQYRALLCEGCHRALSDAGIDWREERRAA